MTDAPRFAGGKAVKVVPLEYPVEFDGRVWDSVTLKRMTAREVQNFIEAVMAGSLPDLPIAQAPAELLDALDDDDRQRIEEEVVNFLPARLRAARELGATQSEDLEQPSPDGDDTSSS